MAGPYDLWRNNYDVPGPQDPRRVDEVRASPAPRWEELLSGRTVSAINQNPLFQALGRFLSKPSTGISETTRLSPIDYRPTPSEPGALDRLPGTVQEGIGGLALLANFLAPGVKLPMRAMSTAEARGGTIPAAASKTETLAGSGHQADLPAPNQQPSAPMAGGLLDHMRDASSGPQALAPRNLTQHDPLSNALPTPEKLGFDTSNRWYHVTDRDFKAFKKTPPTRNTDPDAAFLAKLGTWVSDSPATVAQQTGMVKDGSRTIPLYARGDLYDVGSLAELWQAAQRPGFKKKLQEQGYSGIRMIDTEFGGKGSPVHSAVIFEPKNLRSPNAQFDPQKSGSANIMAGLAGSATLSPAVLNALERALSEQEPQL
jgi:hypothetical protein